MLYFMALSKEKSLGVLSAFYLIKINISILYFHVLKKQKRNQSQQKQELQYQYNLSFFPGNLVTLTKLTVKCSKEMVPRKKNQTLSADCFQQLSFSFICAEQHTHLIICT